MLPEPSIRIAAFAGSLRQASLNAALINAASSVLPDGVSLEILDLHEIPLYNEDVRLAGEPEPVRRFKQHLADADAVLIATPEYNGSVPGVLKNALDWASRPPNNSPLSGKPAAIIGAGGSSGTARAQLALRQITSAMDMLVMNRPTLLVARAWEKFDSQGQLTDEATRQQLTAVLHGLTAWTRRLSSHPQPAGMQLP